MNLRSKLYVAAISAGALLSSFVLYSYENAAPAQGIGPVVLLCALALVAEALALLMPNSVVGSIAFIPYLATALIVPHWWALVGVVLVRTVAEAMSKRVALTRLLNISQQVVTFAIAV